MKRIAFALLLILIAAKVYADWLNVTVGRITVQEFVEGNDMMSYLSSAGTARVDAYEKLSQIVDEFCVQNPGRCAALGVAVHP